MSTATCSCNELIGETAGLVWQILDAEGAISLAQLTKKVGTQRDVVMQAVGWLAREKKVVVEETPRGRRISLG